LSSVVALLALGVGILTFAPEASAAIGDLTQKPGTAGCISEDGTGGACADGTALDQPRSVTVSPDGTSAYVASFNSDAVAVFDRDAATGALTQKPGTAGCISEDGTGGACANGVALNGAVSVTVSPDGTSAYVASFNSDAVAVYDRDAATGELTQKPPTASCIAEIAVPGGACADGIALNGARSVTVSPDGKNVYVTSLDSHAVAVFDRDPTTGALTQKPGTAGCVSESGTGGACADGMALDGALSVVVSLDGASAYVASEVSDAVAVFDRITAAGELTQKVGTAACISEDGTGGACANGVALDRPSSLTVSPDGRSAYATSWNSDAVAIFDRETDTKVDGSAKAKKKQKQKGKKIVVEAKVKAEENLTAKASGKVKVKQKSYKLKPQTKGVASGNKKTLKLKPKKSMDAKKIAKALRRGKKATAKLEVKLTDEAGNQKTAKPKVKLKR